MSADLRGFRYGLAPLAKLEASRLQTAELRLADATARARQGDAALRQVKEAVRRFMAGLESETVGETVDVSLKQLTTRYVVELHGTVARMESRAAALEAERTRALDAWNACRRRVEQLDMHHEEAAVAYAREWAANAFRQADDDWIMRGRATLDAYANEDGHDDDRT